MHNQSGRFQELRAVDEKKTLGERFKFLEHFSEIYIWHSWRTCFFRLDVSFGAFLAVILGLFIPVVFLITLYIQSEAQGTATSFRNPDSSGGQRFDA